MIRCEVDVPEEETEAPENEDSRSCVLDSSHWVESLFWCDVICGRFKGKNIDI